MSKKEIKLNHLVTLLEDMTAYDLGSQQEQGGLDCLKERPNPVPESCTAWIWNTKVQQAILYGMLVEAVPFFVPANQTSGFFLKSEIDDQSKRRLLAHFEADCQP